MFFGNTDLVNLIGHFHPLLVHLPIGVLVFALIISVIPLKQRANMAPALSLSLLISSFSALAACVAGYLLSLSGEYDAELVAKHQWLGIATCVLSFTAFYVVRYRRIVLWCTVLIMAVASHLGGTITHGEGYLFALGSGEVGDGRSGDATDSTASVHPMAPIDSANALDSTDASDSTAVKTRQVFMYRDEIKPILESRCYACHSAVKKKGGLRLDAESFINRGGKNGSILTKGDPNKSALYSHLVLPLEDEMHMPPKGKKQLGSAEIAMIHRWIKKGAPFGMIVESSAVSTSPVASTTDATASAPANSPASRANAFNAGGELSTATDIAGAQSAVLSTAADQHASIPAGDADAIRLLTQQGVVVAPVSVASFGLAINFVNVPSIDPSALEALNRLAEQVVELKFTRQPIGDKELQSLAVFHNLKKLQLERTGITDEGVKILGKYTNLETLNLYGNAVTDKGLEALTSCIKLKRLYLWQTATTRSGIEALKQSIRGLDIESGSLQLSKPDSTSNK